MQMQSLRYFHHNNDDGYSGDGDEKSHENDDGDYDDNVRTL